MPRWPSKTEKAAPGSEPHLAFEVLAQEGLGRLGQVIVGELEGGEVWQRGCGDHGLSVVMRCSNASTCWLVCATPKPKRSLSLRASVMTLSDLSDVEIS